MNLVGSLTLNTAGWSSGLSNAGALISKFANNTVAQVGQTTRAWLSSSQKSTASAASAARANAASVGAQARASVAANNAIAASAKAAASQQVAKANVVIQQTKLQQISLRSIADAQRAAQRAAQTRLNAEAAAARAAQQQQQQQMRMQLAQLNVTRQMQRESLGSGIAGGFAKAGLALNGISAIGNVFKSIGGQALGLVEMAADAEQTAISFEVMLGSGQTATQMLSEMRSFAASTPLETTDIQDAGKTLLQFGVDANNVMPMLKMLGDVSGGNSERFKSMSLAFGKMASTGRLMGQELNMMVDAGFNPLKAISDKTGESMADLKKKMESGGISTQMVVEAFQTATGAGGQFNGMMQRQSQTTAGLFSTLKDNVSLAMVDIGKALIDGFDLNGLMADAGSFLEMFRGQWMPAIIQGINSVGAGWKIVLGGMKQAWTDWILPTIEMIGLFVTNWDISLQLIPQYGRLALMNLLTIVEDVLGYGVDLVGWFGENFSQVMVDAVNAQLTVFMNLATNVKSIFQSIFDFIATGQWTAPDMTPLLEGFEATASELPQMMTRELQGSTPEIDALFAELGNRAAAVGNTAGSALTAGMLAGANAGTSPGMTPFSSSATGGSKSSDKKFGEAAEFGSAAAAKTLMNHSGGKSRMETLAERQAKAAEAAVKELQKLPTKIPFLPPMGVAII